MTHPFFLVVLFPIEGTSVKIYSFFSFLVKGRSPRTDKAAFVFITADVFVF